VTVKLARSHIFDHTLTQLTDSVSFAHGETQSRRSPDPRRGKRG
jgi:hypothetical protein